MASITNSHQFHQTYRKYIFANRAYTDHWTYQRWDQVYRRSKHPLLTGHTQHEPHLKHKFSRKKISVYRAGQRNSLSKSVRPVNGTMYSKCKAHTDPLLYHRCDQLPNRSKHPLSTGHTHCDPHIKSKIHESNQCV